MVLPLRLTPPNRILPESQRVRHLKKTSQNTTFPSCDIYPPLESISHSSLPKAPPTYISTPPDCPDITTKQFKLQ